MGFHSYMPKQHRSQTHSTQWNDYKYRADWLQEHHSTTEPILNFLTSYTLIHYSEKIVVRTRKTHSQVKTRPLKCCVAKSAAQKSPLSWVALNSVKIREEFLQSALNVEAQILFRYEDSGPWDSKIVRRKDQVLFSDDQLMTSVTETPTCMFITVCVRSNPLGELVGN